MGTCFIGSGWHNRTEGQFAGTVIFVFFLVVLVEYLRVYFRVLELRTEAMLKGPTDTCTGKSVNGTNGNSEEATKGSAVAANGTNAPPTNIHMEFLKLHFLRSLIYCLQFSGAYVIMLFLMYYNGYVILAIFLGGFVGFFVANYRRPSLSLAYASCC